MVAAAAAADSWRWGEGLLKRAAVFLTTTIPPSCVYSNSPPPPRSGDEGPKVAAFKEALGLGDEEAAPVFIEVGRRLSRAGYEVNNRLGQFEQRKAFQRLIYLSYSVFGEQKAAFLLPWRRVFNLNDSQLFVARRDNARAIFGQHLKDKCGGDLPADRTVLRELRDYQTAIKLMDDVAEDAVRLTFWRERRGGLVFAGVAAASMGHQKQWQRGQR